MQLYQYYTAFCANLLALDYGIFVGWMSPMLPLLQSSNTPLSKGPITQDQATTIGSIMFVGLLTGIIVIGSVADRFGRRVAIYLATIPLMLSWILLIIADRALLLYLARAIGGFSGGGCYAVIPLYVSEIAENRIRGRLGALLQGSASLGMLTGFTWGAFLNYYLVSYLALIFPIIFIIGFSIVPETPAFLVAKHRYEEAVESLKFFRGYKNSVEVISDEVQAEINALEIKSTEKKLKFSELKVEDFTNKAARRAIIISITVLVMTQGCGAYVLISYASMIFKEAGSTFSPNVSAIIVGLLQFCSALVSPILIERAGRKMLLCASGLSTGICLVFFGTFLYLESIPVDVSNLTWIPIVTVSGAIVNIGWGIAPLPCVIVAEVLPIRIRSTIAMVGRVALATTGFFILKFYYDVCAVIGSYGAQWIFAAFCFAYIAFIAWFLPETKGRSVDDIVKSLAE